MRFLLGVFVGYNLRGSRKLLIIVLTTIVLFEYVIIPTVALLALRFDVQRERQSRPAQTRVPSIKGLNQQDAETKLRASNLNIRLLATRYDLPLQPGIIIDQSPQSGEEVNYGSAVNVVSAEVLRLSVVNERVDRLCPEEKFQPSSTAFRSQVHSARFLVSP
jgi:PASTA domain